MTRARDVMRREVVSVGAADSIDKAVRLMLDQRLGAVPVVDTNGHGSVAVVIIAPPSSPPGTAPPARAVRARPDTERSSFLTPI